MQDDAEQCETVAQLIEQEAAENRTVRILDLVLLETFRVLESIYDFDRAAWSQVLSELLEDAAFRACQKITVTIRLVLLPAGGVAPRSQIAICSIVAPCQRPKLRRPIDTLIFFQALKR